MIQAKRSVTWTVLFSLLFTPLFSGVTPAAVANEPEGHGFQFQKFPFEEFLPNIPKDGITPHKDPALLTKQYHRVFEKVTDSQGTITDQVRVMYPLNTLDVDNPHVDIVNPSQELQFIADVPNSELTIARIDQDTKNGRTHLLNGHVITGVHITSNIISDPNLVVFGTHEGLRAILTAQLTSQAFKAPLVVTLPAPIPLETGAKIRRIGFITRQTGPSGEETGYVRAGDISVEVETASGESAHSVIPREELLLNVRLQLLQILAMVQVTNPDLDSLEVTQKILRETAEDARKFTEMREAYLDSPQNDLLRHALTSIAQQDSTKTLFELFQKDQKGRDAFQNLAAQPRDTVPASRTTWQQQIANELKENENNLEKNYKEEMGRFARFGQRIDKMWKSVVTSKRMRILAAALAGGTAAHFAGAPVQEWGLSTLTTLYDLSLHVPGLRTITEPLGKTAPTFLELWPTVRCLVGASAVMALYPISMAVGKVMALRKIGDRSAARGFFEFGIRAYAYLNYPAQKYLWMLFRQKRLYQAMDLGIDPLENTKAFNSPVASPDNLRTGSQELSQSITQDALRKSRAMLIAAAVISEGQQAKGTPIDLASLLMAGEGKKTETFVNLLADTTEQTKWLQLTMDAYHALQELSDKGIGTVDTDTLKEYLAVYGKIADEFAVAQRGETPISKRLKDVLSRSAHKARKFMSRKILSYVFFGKQGYDLFRRYRNVHIDHTTTEIAKESYRDDYIASAAYYAGVAPVKFGDVAIAGTASPEILFNQLSQVFIYGVQGAVDPLTNAVKDPFTNPYRPITDNTYQDQRVREQTVTEGVAAIARGSMDSEKGFFANHARYLVNVIEGFQVRFAADYLTRAGGLYLTAIAAGGAASLVGSFFTAAPLSAFFLLNKTSFHLGAIGYATVWPYIQLSMRYMKESAKKNALRLQNVDYMIQTGIQTKDQSLLAEGVRELKQIFHEARITLDSKFDTTPEKFTAELANELHALSLKEVPLPTRNNGKIARFLNIGIGAMVSTVLFDGLSTVAYDPNVNALSRFTQSLVDFGATYGGLLGASYLLTKAPKIYQAAKGACQKILGRLTH